MSFPQSAAPLSRSQDDDEQIIHDRVAIAFVVLQLVGAFGLTIVVLTAMFGRGVRRYSTWYSFGALWVFSCISYTLLAFAGQRTGPEPNTSLCLVQSALIYAAPTLTGCTTLSLIVHMLLNLRRLLANTPFNTESRAIVALIIFPYIVWLAFFLGVFFYGLDNPDTVRRSPNNTYCDSTNPVLSHISSLVVLSCMVLIVAIQGIIALRLFRNRRMISGSSQSITMALRVMVFSIIGALALGVAVAYVITWQHDQAFDMILASLPVLALLIFGSQLDLIRIWTCRPHRTSTITEKPLILSRYSAVSSNESFDG